MKLNLLFLSLLLLAFVSSCKKIDKTPTPASLAGSFTGQFLRIHYPPNSTKTDTLTANLTLTIQANTNFAVTGDTTTLHAGSRGFFSITSAEGIQFFDQTYPASGMPAKIHLSGNYIFSYDNVVLRLTGYGPADTLAYQYILRKN